MVKEIYLLRHAERLDRAMEKNGEDWISSAPRPQDPPLSKRGFDQITTAGKMLQSKGITKILCSPMIRTVQSADRVAEKLGFGAKSICIEEGLIEEAKSMRGKTSSEPMPFWEPLVQSTKDATLYSDKINESYSSLIQVEHIKDEAMPNTVAEVHSSLPMDPEMKCRDAITKARCEQCLNGILASDELANEIVLLVCHGAIVKWMSFALQSRLDESARIQGERNVSCFAGFVPHDDHKSYGTWKSSTTHWETGDVAIDAQTENADDRGDNTI